MEYNSYYDANSDSIVVSIKPEVKTIKHDGVSYRISEGSTVFLRSDRNYAVPMTVDSIWLNGTTFVATCVWFDNNCHSCKEDFLITTIKPLEA